MRGNVTLHLSYSWFTRYDAPYPDCKMQLFAALQGGDLTSVQLHPKTLQAHTSAPLLVRLQDNEAVIIAHRVACLEF